MWPTRGSGIPEGYLCPTNDQPGCAFVQLNFNFNTTQLVQHVPQKLSCLAGAEPKVKNLCLQPAHALPQHSILECGPGILLLQPPEVQVPLGCSSLQ